MSILNYPRGVGRVVQALAELRRKGFEAAHYETLATLLDQSVNHVKTSCAEAAAAGLLTIVAGGGRGKKSAVMLTTEGAALVPLATPRSAGS